jgi:hypothetical protein
MSGFTTEELEAVGLRRGVNWGFAILSAQDRNGFYRSIGGSWPELADCWLWMAPQSSRDGAADAVAINLVRLAIAHPERAHLALGEGWEYDDCEGGCFVLTMDTADGPWSIVATREDVELGPPCDPDGLPCYYRIPPEFDANLARARRISAALAAIGEWR